MGHGVYLYWIPLGAGGSGFVRRNGRMYEWIVARRQRRPPLDLYHTALEVRLPAGRFVVETMWPSPRGDPAQRGVVMAGPVFGKWLSSSRLFRYEVRCWRDGVLPDADAAVGGPRLVAEPRVGEEILSLSAAVPADTWGRDALGVGDMWNSNSVVSWLLASSGVDMTSVVPPKGGRAPGWRSGMAAAVRVVAQ